MTMSEESVSPGRRSSTDKDVCASQVKAHACVLCQQRKVKCDRLITGCTNCTKARVECIYRPPAPPRRRKKGQPPQPDLLVRLTQYEEILKSLGVDVDTYQAGVTPIPSLRKDEDIAAEDLEKFKLAGRQASEGSLSETLPAHLRPDSHLRPVNETGALVTGSGPNGTRKARYLANALYVGVRDEVKDELLDESGSESESEGASYNSPDGTPGSHRPDVADLLLRPRRSHIKLHDMHPSPVVSFKLWQAFLDNVNPLCKTLHIPTTQQLILESVARLHELSAATEALLFCIYLVAVTSLEDDDCESVTGERRDTLLLRYQFASQQALANAGLLKTSDIRVLQAFSLFLPGIIRYHDPRTMWALTGLACRIAQRMGLHRDGMDLGLSVFETEMRRRLWWELLFQDGRATELAGAGGEMQAFDTKPPLNIDDGRLFPDMKESPIEHTGPTEMLFTKMRCEIADWLRHAGFTPNFGRPSGSWNHLMSSDIPRESKLSSVDWLEDRLRTKYLQHIDLSIPLHFLCAAAVQIIVSKMRFLAHLRVSEDQEACPNERERSFMQALNILEAELWFNSNDILKRFRWAMGRHIQYQGFIYLLTELRTRTTGDEVIRAWKMIGQTMLSHGDLMKSEARRPLHVAVGNLAIKAWDAFEASHGKHAYTLVESGDAPPEYIQILRVQRKLPKIKDAADTLPTQISVTNEFQANIQPDLPNSYNVWPNTRVQTTITPPSSTSTAGIGVFQELPVTTQQGIMQQQSHLPAQQPLPQSFNFNGSTFPIIDNTGMDDIPMDWGQWESMLNNFNEEQYGDIGMGAGVGAGGNIRMFS